MADEFDSALWSSVYDDLYDTYGVRRKGKTGARVSASIDNWQANLYGFGEELTKAVGMEGASNWLADRRVSNEAEANANSRRAQQLGAIDTWDDVNSVSDFGDYAAGLFIQSAPYMTEALGGGVAARGLMSGTRAALAGANETAALARGGANTRFNARRLAEAEAQASNAKNLLRLGGTAGAVGTSYPSSVGDILSSQRDQSGETDFGTAAVLGVPYAAANAIGIEGALARGSLYRNAVSLLDDTKGVRGALGRAAATGARTGVVEAGAETFQEGMNQLGRMAVDPNEAFLSDAAQERFKESAIGGGILGGMMGAGAGGWRRSAGYKPPETPQEPLMLESPEVLAARQAEYQDAQARERAAGPRVSPAVTGIATAAGESAQAAGDRQAAIDAARESLFERFGAPETRTSDTGGTEIVFGGKTFKNEEALEKALQKDINEELRKTDLHRGVEQAYIEAYTLDNPEGKRLAPKQVMDRVKAAMAGPMPDTLEGVVGRLDQRIASEQGNPNRNDKFIKNMQQFRSVLTGEPMPSVEPAATAAKAPTKAPAAQTVPAQPDNVAAPATIRQEQQAPGEVVTLRPDENGNLVPVTPDTQTPPSGEAGLRNDATTEDEAETAAKTERRRTFLRQAFNEREAEIILASLDQPGASQTQISDEVNARLKLSGEGKVTQQSVSATLNKFNPRKNKDHAQQVQAKVLATADKLGLKTKEEVTELLGVNVFDNAAPEALTPGEVVADELTLDRRELSGNEEEEGGKSGSISIINTAGGSQGDIGAGADTVLLRRKEKLQERLEKAQTAEDVQKLSDAIEAIDQQLEELATGEASQQKAKEQVDKAAAARQRADRNAQKETAKLTPEQTEMLGAISKLDEDIDVAERTGASREALRLRADRDRLNTKLNTSIRKTNEQAEKAAKKAKPAKDKSAPKAESTAPKTEPKVEPEAEAEPVTAQEKYAAVTKGFPVPAFDELPAKAQNQIKDLADRDQLNLAAVNRIVGEQGNKFGKGIGPVVDPKDAYTAKDLIAELKRFMRVGTLGRRVVIVDQPTDLPPSMLRDIVTGLTNEQAFGWTRDGRAIIIASRIRRGEGTAKFMHEVGSHLGLEGGQLSRGDFDNLSKQIVEWADRNDESRESRLARQAIARVGAANTPDGALLSEAVAYFIEEAILDGVDPTASSKLDGPLRSWFKTLMAAFQQALTKLGIKPETLNAQDVVDLAYGAARLALDKRSIRNAGELRFGKNTDAAIDRLPKSLQSPARSITATLADYAKRAGYASMFTEDLADLAAKYLPSVRAYIEAGRKALKVQSEVEHEIDAIYKRFDTLPQHERGVSGAVNKLINDSTRNRQWAFTPSWLPKDAQDKIKVDAALSARHKALSPEAQKVVEDVFRYGYEMLNRKKAAVRKAINDMADATLKDVPATDTATKESVERRRTLQLKRFETLFKIDGTQPYAPFKRFGNYVAVLKSADYVAAEENNDQKKLKEYVSDSRHYVVSFFDTAGQAKEFVRLNERNFVGGDTNSFPKNKGKDALYGTSDVHLAFAQIRNALRAEMGQEGADNASLRATERLINDLYVRTLAEESARRAELPRQNVAGADEDMMRAFVTQGRADAHFLSSISHNNEIIDSLGAMNREAKEQKGDARGEAVTLLNEFSLRHSESLEYQNYRVQDAVRRLTSVYFLSTSPAYYVQQLVQPLMYSLPVMGGRFGYGRSLNAINRAYVDMLGLIKSAKAHERMDFSKADPSIRAVVQAMVDAGRVDMSIDFDMGRLESKNSLLNEVDRVLRGLNEKAESINRIATAVAAHRLYMEEYGSKPDANEKAKQYAERLLHQTHGSYDGFNTPRIMGGKMIPGGRMIFQFRKFQIIQIALLTRLINNSLGESTPERAVARRALKYTLLHAAAMGGLMGMPGAATVAWLADKLLSDDDEPWDSEQKLRAAIGDKFFADLLVKGMPGALGLSILGDKTTWGQAFAVLPFTEIDLSSRSGVEKTLLGTLGASAGLVARLGDGIGLMGKGDYYKGLEQLVPNGFTNAMKGLRFADEGVTMRNGDLVLPPEDISTIDTVMQMLGLPTNLFTDRQRKQNQLIKYEDFYKNRTDEIRLQYVKASRSNDSASMREAQDEWMELQESRVRNGFTRQPLSNLLKAPMQQSKREQQVVDGVRGTRSNRGFLEQVAQ